MGWTQIFGNAADMLYYQIKILDHLLFHKATVNCQHLISSISTMNMSCVLFSLPKPLEAGITHSLRLFKAGHFCLKWKYEIIIQN